jgi:hypothetical protein
MELNRTWYNGEIAVLLVEDYESQVTGNKASHFSPLNAAQWC